MERILVNTRDYGNSNGDVTVALAHTSGVVSITLLTPNKNILHQFNDSSDSLESLTFTCMDSLVPFTLWMAINELSRKGKLSGTFLSVGPHNIDWVLTDNYHFLWGSDDEKLKLSDWHSLETAIRNNDQKENTSVEIRANGNSLGSIHLKYERKGSQTKCAILDIPYLTQLKCIDWGITYRINTLHALHKEYVRKVEDDANANINESAIEVMALCRSDIRQLCLLADHCQNQEQPRHYGVST